tara:strand:+ start:90 stop:305 length:216 start_codon:yes stop_codon:yes gene_type:complete
MNNNLENYLTYKAKFDRMKSVLGSYTMEIKVESMKPLIDDGFDLADIVDYFTIELEAYVENRYKKEDEKEN